MPGARCRQFTVSSDAVISAPIPHITRGRLLDRSVFQQVQYRAFGLLVLGAPRKALCLPQAVVFSGAVAQTGERGKAVTVKVRWPNSGG